LYLTKFFLPLIITAKSCFKLCELLPALREQNGCTNVLSGKGFNLLGECLPLLWNGLEFNAR
jgi:hypothetical protein